jgi:uncharacterized protein (TIGR02757 family)
MNSKANISPLIQLEELYTRFNDPLWLGTDPLSMVDRTLSPEDFEIVSFLVAGLSYGRVEQIQKSAAHLLFCLRESGIGPGGQGLAAFLKDSSRANDENLGEILHGWVHRMNTASDLRHLLVGLGKLLREDGSLCRVFQKSWHEEAKEQLVNFASRICAAQATVKRGKKWTGTGGEWFAASPAKGGTSKRLMMWLRWMIRQDNIDPGTWQHLKDPGLPLPSPSRLFYPVDTHIFNWARKKRLVKRKSPNWAGVEEITSYFRKLKPEDPVRYDFALCHASMETFRSKKP